MSQTTLVAHTGRATGSPASRRLRTEGHIPGVIYGQGMKPITLTVERRELRLALSGSAGVNTVLSIQVDGASYPAIIKELQRHPVRRTVSHIDFLQVNMNEEITVMIPVHLDGEAKAVTDLGGLVDAAVDAIEVSCTPGNLPDQFLIDISAMTVDSVIRLGDVAMPKGVTAHGDPDTPVVTVLFGALGPATDAEAAEAEAAEAAEAEAEATEAAEAADGGTAKAADDTDSE